MTNNDIVVQREKVIEELYHLEDLTGYECKEATKAIELLNSINCEDYFLK